MSFLLEVVFQFVVEFLAYGVGRAVLLVFAPHVGVELQAKSAAKSPRKSWHWRGFTFMSNGKRYFFIETVQMVGLVVILALVVMVAVVRKSAK